MVYFLFFFNQSPTTEFYTLSLHDALPISLTELLMSDQPEVCAKESTTGDSVLHVLARRYESTGASFRSEEHTSELQSRPHLVCRLLLEKKKYYIPAQLIMTTSPTHTHT